MLCFSEHSQHTVDLLLTLFWCGLNLFQFLNRNVKTRIAERHSLTRTIRLIVAGRSGLSAPFTCHIYRLCKVRIICNIISTYVIHTCLLV
ncbi:hypothetical protein DJ70_13085 [Halorubrum halodurans]|uniref:Uncharacterized protein n=1 Tax=Halorubrum halodurans TaxID=1383851 RepID=A0A256IE17_9EURY|nr:hypothetical protein DJ70_13085 [Halorubrum halodurans]